MTIVEILFLTYLSCFFWEGYSSNMYWERTINLGQNILSRNLSNNHLLQMNDNRFETFKRYIKDRFPVSLVKCHANFDENEFESGKLHGLLKMSSMMLLRLQHQVNPLHTAFRISPQCDSSLVYCSDLVTMDLRCQWVKVTEREWTCKAQATKKASSQTFESLWITSYLILRVSNVMCHSSSFRLQLNWFSSISYSCSRKINCIVLLLHCYTSIVNYWSTYLWDVQSSRRFSGMVE